MDQRVKYIVPPIASSPHDLYLDRPVHSLMKRERFKFRDREKPHTHVVTEFQIKFLNYISNYMFRGN